MHVGKITFLIFSFSIVCNIVLGQKEIVFTKAFDEKLKTYGLEYIQPSEIFLHPTPHKDKYDEYDIALWADNQKIEVRYIFRDASSPIGLSSTPHLEFYRSIIDFASNEPDRNQISIRDISPEVVGEKYNADWCLQADFTPKASISLKPHGRVLGIYKEDSGLIFCLVFYEELLPDYFELPIRFKKNEDKTIE